MNRPSHQAADDLRGFAKAPTRTDPLSMEAAWREDHRKEPNSVQVGCLVGLAMPQ
jgi:hypothetical protein